MTSDDLYHLRPSQIVLYGADWCPDCRRAKYFFELKRIPYLDVNVEQDGKAESFVRRLNNGLRSIPTILFPDGCWLVEPSTDELQRKFLES